jgi:hypothetical protein
MALRLRQFDGHFELEPQAQKALFALLASGAFRAQVSAHLGCREVHFLELLFQPVPYSTLTPHGMPRALEPYHFSDEYAVVNVPANFMFQSRIAMPNRLCAIYHKEPFDRSAPAQP